MEHESPENHKEDTNGAQEYSYLLNYKALKLNLNLCFLKLKFKDLYPPSSKHTKTYTLKMLYADWA